MRLLFALLLGSSALATCRSTRLPAGRYDTAAAYQRGQPSLAGANAGLNFLHTQVFVARPASGGSRLRVPQSQAWGYVNAAGQSFRLVKRQPYEVLQADTLSIYHKGKQFYFSSGLSGPLRRLTRHQLRRAFAGNSAFVALPRQRHWYQSANARAANPAGPRTYRVVALYRQALGLPAAAAR